MKAYEAKQFRNIIQSEIISGSNAENCYLLQEDWRGMLLDNHRYHDTQSGNISDNDFRLISTITECFYGDRDVFLVSLERYDLPDKKTFEPIPQFRAAANSLAGYDEFKREPGLLDFYMFGRSMKWIIYANPDWSVVAGDALFFGEMMKGFGGMAAYLDRLSKDLGLPDPTREMTSNEKIWLNFILRILRVERADVEKLFLGAN